MKSPATWNLFCSAAERSSRTAAQDFRAGAPAMEFVLTSRAFSHGGVMPPRYAGQEDNGGSPPLEWAGAPAATRTFALIAETPDAGPGAQTRWVLFNVPRHICRLPEAMPPVGRIRQVACNGVNDFQTVGYVPPCRPARTQGWCVFILYALDIELPCGPRTDRAALRRAMKGHVLAVARLTARCECCSRESAGPPPGPGLSTPAESVFP